MKKKTLVPILVILAIIVAIGIALIGPYNNLVRLEENVNESYATVQSAVQRRADLIPNLVATVKGYATHEEETFTKVTEARNNVGKASNAEELTKANDELSSAINGLNVVVERYPELKANTNFLDLQAQLEGTENRISTERQRYNEKVKEYNQVVRSFPMNIFANIFGFEKKAYFEISAEDEKVPEVNF